MTSWVIAVAELAELVRSTNKGRHETWSMPKSMGSHVLEGPASECCCLYGLDSVEITIS
jgi:hypothetical protein